MEKVIQFKKGEIKNMASASHSLGCLAEKQLFSYPCVVHDKTHQNT